MHEDGNTSILQLNYFIINLGQWSMWAFFVFDIYIKELINDSDTEFFAKNEDIENVAPDSENAWS